MPTLIRNATTVKAAGNKPKLIEEFIGRINSGTGDVSIARMKSPGGWTEPGQTPEFDEYTIVLRGMVRVKTRNEVIDIREGQVVITNRGEWSSTARLKPKVRSISPFAFRRFHSRL